MENKFTFRENWYFIRQDIVSYLMSTFLYVFLSLIKDFSIQSVGYALFDCLVFYLPFWYIRINFASTYHSDSWKHCKMWTRIMLCVGVTILWVLPVRYSLFNGLLVAFACCLVLYLVSLEVNQKKRVQKELAELQCEVAKILAEINEKDKVDIYSMDAETLYKHCRSRGLDDVECKIAYFVVIERLKGRELYETIGYSEIQSKRKRKSILDRIK